MDLKKIPDDLLDEIKTKVTAWSMHVGFSSSRSVACNAVAEYLANTQGYILYDYMVGKPNPAMLS